MERRIRVLVGKPGLDGHDRGAKVVAAALRDAGMEVIYTGLHQSPEQIVEAALQEDVDVVALSILSGAHMTLFPEVLKLMKQRGIGDKLLSGGGIVSQEDMEALARMGVGRLFGPGASTQEIADYFRAWFAEKHGKGALADAPATGVSTRPAVASSSRGARASGGGSASRGASARVRRGTSARTPSKASSHAKRALRSVEGGGRASRRGASRRAAAGRKR